MATKKSVKSSKTAHVLNVIAPTKDSIPIEEEGSLPVSAPATRPVESVQVPAQAPVQAAPAAPQPPARPLLPPILEDARANEDALGSKIFDALSLELEASLENEPDAVSEPEAPPVPPATEPEPEPMPELEPESTPPEPVQAPQPTAATPAAPQIVAPISVAAETLPDDLVYVNIMQALVEEKAQRYINMFGLCTCSRCVADVKAVALSNLPPKYAVMPKGDMIPMLTVYERRYGSTLTAQIIAACTLVMQSPRHTPGK